MNLFLTYIPTFINNSCTDQGYTFLLNSYHYYEAYAAQIFVAQRLMILKRIIHHIP